MTQQLDLRSDKTLNRAELSEHRVVLAWLRSGESVWPAILLAGDAVLIRAPKDVLTIPASDFDVVVESSQGVSGPNPVSEVRLIADRLSAHQGLAVAMIRLSTPSVVGVRSTVDRVRYWAQMRKSPDFWLAVNQLGLVPSDLAQLTPPARLAQLPLSPSFPVVRTARNSWCDIFWWLC
jgi:hypothetical protein